MHIRISEKLLAWSKDGQSALVEHGGGGPEGGHGYALRVVSAVRGVNTRYLISSTYSPGDGSEPQSVSAKVCRSRLTHLQADLKSAGFEGITVDLKACEGDADARLSAVQVTPPIDADRQEKYPPQFIYPGCVLTPKDHRLEVVLGTSAPVVLSIPDVDKGKFADARISPDRQWILLFWTPPWLDPYDEQVLAQHSLLARKDKPGGFVSVAFPEMREGQ